MPLCTLADVKHAARLDSDQPEHDTAIPGLIEVATVEIEQQCNVPEGWFDQPSRPRGWAAARQCAIALCALRIDDPMADGAQLLNSSMLWAARYPGQMPTIPDVATLTAWSDAAAWNDAALWAEA